MNLQKLFRFMRADQDSLGSPLRSVISAMADLVISNLASAERMVRVFSFTVTTTATMPLLVTILSPARTAFRRAAWSLAFFCWGRMRAK